MSTANQKTLTDAEYRALRKRLARGGDFVWLARKLDYKHWPAVRRLNLAGIEHLVETKRVYPHGELACHVLGFAGVDNQGLEGLELFYEKELRGREGWIYATRDGMGNSVRPAEKKYSDSVEGFNLHLTIDSTVQHVTEVELQRAYQETRARAASAIVMEPDSGRVLAIANFPNYDPNLFSKYEARNRRNRVVTDMYEPGSTFKVVTAASALESGIATEDDMIHCRNGVYWIDGHEIHDSEPHGWLTFRQVLEESSSIGMARIGIKVGAQRFFRDIGSFGFGEKTGVDLPGEVEGVLHPVEQWTEASIAAMSYGMGISVTPLQMLAALNVVANNGLLVAPYVVEKITTSHGKIVKRHQASNKKRVISADTARRLRRVMQGVIENGTGRRAKLEGVNAAGKTGTAQKVDPHTGKYSAYRHVASFIGFAPTEEPQLAILVLLDEPKGIYWGGHVAAPVFQRVAQRTLSCLGVGAEQEIKLAGSEPASVSATTSLRPAPNFLGLNRQEAERIAKLGEVKIEFSGDGPRVVKQGAPVGTAVGQGARVELTMGEGEDLSGLVPDLTGKSLSAALVALSERRLKVRFRGQGRVVRQKPIAGRRVKPGTIIDLTLALEK